MKKGDRYNSTNDWLEASAKAISIFTSDGLKVEIESFRRSHFEKTIFKSFLIMENKIG